MELGFSYALYTNGLRSLQLAVCIIKRPMQASLERSLVLPRHHIWHTIRTPSCFSPNTTSSSNIMLTNVAQLSKKKQPLQLVLQSKLLWGYGVQYVSFPPIAWYRAYRIHCHFLQVHLSGITWWKISVEYYKNLGLEKPLRSKITLQRLEDIKANKTRITRKPSIGKILLIEMLLKNYYSNI